MSLKLRIWTLSVLAGLCTCAPIWGQAAFTIACSPTNVQPGQTVNCTVSAQINAATPVDSLNYTIEVNPGTGNPTGIVLKASGNPISFSDGLSADENGPNSSYALSKPASNALTPEWVQLQPTLTGSVS